MNSCSKSTSVNTMQWKCLNLIHQIFRGHKSVNESGKASESVIISDGWKTDYSDLAATKDYKYRSKLCRNLKWVNFDEVLEFFWSLCRFIFLSLITKLIETTFFNLQFLFQNMSFTLKRFLCFSIRLNCIVLNLIRSFCIYFFPLFWRRPTYSTWYRPFFLFFFFLPTSLGRSVGWNYFVRANRTTRENGRI